MLPSFSGYPQNIKVAAFTDPDSFEVGQRIRQARINKGLKQKELIENQFSKSYISSIEAGRLLPSSRALEFFALRLEVSVDYLQWGSNITNLKPEVSPSYQTPGETKSAPNQHSKQHSRHTRLELALTFAQIELENGRIEKALEILTKKGLHSIEVGAMLFARYSLLLGECFLRSGQPELAIQELLKAQDVTRVLPQTNYLAQVFNGLADACIIQDRRKEALSFRHQAVEALKLAHLKDPAVEANTYYNLANELKSLNEQSKAHDCFIQAALQASLLNKRSKIASIYHEMSIYYQDSGDSNLSKYYADRSLSLYEELKNCRLTLAIHTNNGLLLLEQEDFIEAEKCFSNALKVALDLEDYLSVATAALHLSMTLFHQNKAVEEEKFAWMSLDNARKSDNLAVTGLALARISNMFTGQDNLKEAEVYFSQAVSILETTSTLPALGSIYFEHGRVLMTKNYNREAAAYFEKAYRFQSTHTSQN